MIKETYETQGYYGPVQFLSGTDIDLYTARLLACSEKLDLMNSKYRCKSNVLFPWIDTLSRDPTILSHVKEILGENIHCWDTLIWIKEPETDKFVSWHQDATYWNYLPKERGLTVWVTLSGATEKMGCMEYIAGSHKELKHHVDIKDENNLLMRGQTIETLEKTNAVKVAAPEGSFLMHHPFMFHGSSANTTKTPRLALGFIYAATDAKPIATYAPESTVMINGTDTYNYMLHDPQPMGDWDSDIKNWEAAYERQHENYYRMEQLA